MKEIEHDTRKREVFEIKKGNKIRKESAPNVSGSFQIVENKRKEDLEEAQRKGLDEESMYYARLFMED